tara:strand:+ start:664 stop:1020 length:357 start_codon:yes stop_codon:yes gene_type:complete
MKVRYEGSMATHYTHFTLRELEQINRSMACVEDRLETWLELDVSLTCLVATVEELVDSSDDRPSYTTVLKIDGFEVFRVADDCLVSAVDMVSTWSTRHLILNCGYTGDNEHSLEPAEA